MTQEKNSKKQTRKIKIKKDKSLDTILISYIISFEHKKTLFYFLWNRKQFSARRQYNAWFSWQWHQLLAFSWYVQTLNYIRRDQSRDGRCEKYKHFRIGKHFFADELNVMRGMRGVRNSFAFICQPLPWHSRKANINKPIGGNKWRYDR